MSPPLRLVAMFTLSLISFSCRPGVPQTDATITPTSPLASPTPSPTPSAPLDLPVGFPLDQSLRPMRVTETAQGRELVAPAGDGPTVVAVARDYQPRSQNDLEANRYGWNCRLHNTYEGAPAVDWYLPSRTPVLATMRGQAELFVITTVNSFAYYGVDARLYLGLPSPSLPLYPFAGPSGGMGVFVSVLNGDLRAEYGHLDLAGTLALVPDSGFLAPYSRAFAYDPRFDRPLQPDQGTVVARWTVQKGGVVGFVGNTGYSDVPHLHYQIVTRDRRTKFCPTEEPFPLAGWLFRQP